MSEQKHLRRSRKERMIAGVCGGLAEYFGMDPTLMRVIFVVVSVLSAAFPGILVYIVCMIAIPEADETV
jgi:phage shock protein C